MPQKKRYTYLGKNCNLNSYLAPEIHNTPYLTTLQKTLTIYRLNTVRALKQGDKGKPGNQQKRESECNLHFGDTDFMSLQKASIMQTYEKNYYTMPTSYCAGVYMMGELTNAPKTQCSHATADGKHHQQL